MHRGRALVSRLLGLVSLAVAVGATGAVASACSSDSSADGAGGSGANGTGAGNGTGGTTGAGGFNVGAGGSGTGGIEECAGETHVGDLTPVDVVIMLDQSGSMDGMVGNQTVWQLITTALSDFVQAPDTAGLSVGLQYFPLPDGPCTSCNGCFSPDLQLTDTNGQCCCSSMTGQACALADGTACPGGGVCFQGNCYSGGANATCVTGDYAALEVPVDALPANAPAVLTSLGNHGPAGLTPTAPALAGAIQAAAARAQAFPDHAVAVVLATDGVPTECAPQDIPSIAALSASALAANPSVPTYVIGIGDVSALNAIAAAGGTTKAFLVSVNGNAGQQFLDALNQIKGSLLSCEFDIPQPTEGTLDFDKVNVQFTPNGQQPEILPQVADAGACGADGGWYYDDPAAPTKILLCDASCDEVKATNEATIEIVLGCQTIVK